MKRCKETTSLLSPAGLGNAYTNACQKTKKFADDARNHSSFAPAAIPKGQPTCVTIDTSYGRQQTFTGLATAQHTNSMICVPKLVTHPIEDANVESSTKNVVVESSREIESPSSHDSSNQHTS